MAKTNFTRLFSNSGLLSTGMKIVIFALLLCLAGCGGSTQSPSLPQSSIVFFGDSVFGRMDLNAYFPGKGYINGGMFGYRTDQLKALLPDVISGTKVCNGLDGNTDFPLTCVSIAPPKTIVIMAGWNNFFQGNNVDALVDLQNMAKIAHFHGVKVIICTLYAYDPAHPAPWMVPTGNAPVTFYDMWRDPLNDGIGKDAGITVIDFSAMFAGQSDYTIDGVHPSASGYAQMRDLLNTSL
jgi:lysophospholipase L1-like esterase